MQKIRLNETEWSYDEGSPLGPEGGFGEVFRGVGDQGEVAVKRLKISANAAAHREMNIGRALSSRTLQHVVPVLDYGQDADSDSYFLVMPICDRSLQDEVSEKGALTLSQANAVALDVLSGLREVGDIIHRDLKPGNVLYWEGRWRLADFGIAKFVEDSTSLRTLRGSLTPAYGAPEQWQMDRPTQATDIYALGCIFHTMLTGAPPFVGSQDDVREAHLHSAPPRLDVDARLSAFVGQMLRKTPASRPNLQRCMDVIGSIDLAPARPVHAGLIAAAGRVSQEQAAAEAAGVAAATAERVRKQLVAEATAELDEIIKRLFDDVRSASEVVQLTDKGISLGRGVLEFDRADGVRPPRAGGYESGSTWDVVASARLSVTRAKLIRPSATNDGSPIVYMARARPDDYSYTWSATLFFGKSSQDQNYRWRETAFWSFNASRNGVDAPYALDPEDREFQLAFSNVMGATSVAYGPLAIDGEDEDGFQHRWMSLFTKAVEGTLNRPGSMPVPDHFLR